jgi:asparagine synthase (glutamine-hydrolysing)
MSRGIFGILDFSAAVEESDAAAMAAFLGRDSGDGERIAVVRGTHYFLAMKRSAGDAPWRQRDIAENSELDAVCLINGEIHNCAELRDDLNEEASSLAGDLDLALLLYRRHGRDFAKKLNGIFSLAILDRRESDFLLLSDRFGMARQVYWTTRGTRLFFATHLKTLLACPGVGKELDTEALNLFLKYAYITSPWSIFRGIRKLQPGHMLTFSQGKVEEVPYWDFSASSTTVSGWDEAISAYRSLLRQSVARRLGDADATGILLSGGLDSSANVAMAASCTGKRLKTFSIGFEDPRFDERPYARAVARHFDTRHYEYTITGNEIEDLPKLLWHMEEPYFEFGLFLTYRGLAAAAPEVDAVIGGEGADQLFGTGGFAGARPAAAQYLLRRSGLLGPARRVGRLLRGPFFYDRDTWAFKLRLFWNRATDLNDWYFYGYDEHELAQAYRNRKLAHVPRIFDGQEVDASSFPALYRNTQIHQDIRHYVNENVMVKSGRMADMLGLSLRESFLDAEVADFLVGLDFSFKRGGDLLDHLRGRFTSKLLHRRAMEGILPPEIMTKPKQGGFVPVMLFLRDGNLRRRIYDYLLRSRVMGEYFRSDYLSALFASYEEHQAKPVSWANFLNSKANRILFLLTFDIWHRYYLENDPLRVEVTTLSEYLASANG